MQYGLTLNTKCQPFYLSYLDEMCALRLSGPPVDIPVYGRTRDNIFLPDQDASDIQEQINRLTWHLSDMVRDRHHVTAPEVRVPESSVW